LFAQLRLNGKPTLIFASHLANWGTSRAGCRRVPPRSAFVAPESITGFGFAANGLRRGTKGEADELRVQEFALPSGRYAGLL